MQSLRSSLYDGNLDRWQGIVDLVARMSGACAGLIMRLVDDDIEVLVSSDTPGNPYKAGDREHFSDSGLYCEKVIEKQQLLHVYDARASDVWRDNPDIKLGMVSYLGLPIKLPDGRAFGTICLLDNVANAFSADIFDLITRVRDVIEDQLLMCAQSLQLERYRSMFDSIDEGFCILEPVYDQRGSVRDFRFLEVNPGFKRLVGRDDLDGALLSVSPELCSTGLTTYAQVLQSGTPQHVECELEGTSRCVESYAFNTGDPNEHQLGLILNDVTERKRLQAELSLKQKDQAIRRAYSDVIAAVTGERLVIVHREELESELAGGGWRDYELRFPSELSQARDAVRSHFGDLREVDDLVLAFSEGATNMLKHAGGGKYELRRSHGRAEVTLRDQGPGIDFGSLPRATLVAGFSTMRTLGVGFTIMMEMSDRMLLCTDEDGTVVVLQRFLTSEIAYTH
jgi:anti-sigma regulatory factor (Ser/Thr protein kinase)/PAS domain-containing protein